MIALAAIFLVLPLCFFGASALLARSRCRNCPQFDKCYHGV